MDPAAGNRSYHWLVIKHTWVVCHDGFVFGSASYE